MLHTYIKIAPLIIQQIILFNQWGAVQFLRMPTTFFKFAE